MDEDDVELPPEAERAHVALEVFALAIDSLAHGQHGGRTIGQRQFKVSLEVKGQAAAAGAQFQ
jgi:hypothetical protein